MLSRERVGAMITPQGERVLSVRLHEKCTHKEEHWERKPCGHAWCKMCKGFVNPLNKVALKGPSDIIRCNRLWHDLSSYAYPFRENHARSARLTQVMVKTLGQSRVAPPEDVKYSKHHDMLVDQVFTRKKQEAKKREAFVNHYAPNCRTCSYAQAQYNKRSMTAP